MSDERDSADATGEFGSDGADDSARSGDVESNSRGSQTAVVTPARPTGKRSRQRPRAASDEDADLGDDTDADESDDSTTGDGAKKTKSKSKAGKAKADAGGGILAPFKFVWSYLGQVIAELRKVIWPNRKQMATYTTVVLAFLAFMVALIGFADLGLAKLVLWVFG